MGCQTSIKLTARQVCACPSRSHVLIDEDRVSIGVHGDEAGRPRCAFVGLGLQRHALCLQLPLQFADVGEGGKLLSVWSQPGLKVRMFFSNIP